MMYTVAMKPNSIDEYIAQAPLTEILSNLKADKKYATLVLILPSSKENSALLSKQKKKMQSLLLANESVWKKMSQRLIAMGDCSALSILKMGRL